MFKLQSPRFPNDRMQLWAKIGREAKKKKRLRATLARGGVWIGNSIPTRQICAKKKRTLSIQGGEEGTTKFGGKTKKNLCEGGPLTTENKMNSKQEKKGGVRGSDLE